MPSRILPRRTCWPRLASGASGPTRARRRGKLRDIAAPIRPEVEITRFRVATAGTADKTEKLLATDVPARFLADLNHSARGSQWPTGEPSHRSQTTAVTQHQPAVAGASANCGIRNHGRRFCIFVGNRANSVSRYQPDMLRVLARTARLHNDRSHDPR